MTKSDALELVFYDDAQARTFEPFALSSPFCEMRVGALLLRERWKYALGRLSASFVGAPHLRGFVDSGAPAFAPEHIAANTVLVNSRAAVALSQYDKNASVWRLRGRVAAIRLSQAILRDVLSDGHRSLQSIAEEQGLLDGVVATIDGEWVDEVWDVIRHLAPLMMSDLPELAQALSCQVVIGGIDARGPVITGRHPLWLEAGAVVEPLTVFDTSEGPVLLRKGAVVQAFTRVVGPCYVGRDSTVVADRISGSSIGDVCKVHGEISATVFVGHCNKGHEGFVGHSIAARWVNLGAGTTTSNLKNTYGHVALWTPSGVRNTGLQFLGTLFGEHVKTGIGLQLTTGSVLGTGANVFNNMPPKAVEPFAWGNEAPYATYDVEKFMEAAARMMQRRHVELTDAGRAHWRTVHASRWRVSG